MHKVFSAFTATTASWLMSKHRRLKPMNPTSTDFHNRNKAAGVRHVICRFQGFLEQNFWFISIWNKNQKSSKNGFVKWECVVRGVVGLVGVDVQRDADGEADPDVVAALHHHRRLPRFRSLRLSPDGGR